MQRHRDTEVEEGVMIISQLLPDVAEVGLREMLAELDQAPVVPPFGDALVSFCDQFSDRLFKSPVAKQFPELIALAFWMRRAAVTRLRTELEGLSTSETFLVPAGMVFHIP